MIPGVYVLTTKVTNPNPDRRYSRWDKRTSFAIGTRFVVRACEQIEGRFDLALLERDTHEVTANPKRETQSAELVRRILGSSERRAAADLREIKALRNMTSGELLRELLRRGLVTLADLTKHIPGN